MTRFNDLPTVQRASDWRDMILALLFPEAHMFHAESTSFVYQFGAFELDEGKITLKHNGMLLPVPAKPWSLLILLLKNAPRLVSHREIFQRIWHDRPVTVGVLSQVVTRLRQILADRDQELIKNIHGEGFCFAGKLDIKEAAIEQQLTTVAAISSATRLPGRDPWKLLERLAARGESQVWLAQHQNSQERHVFKFAFDSVSKAALKREIIASRILSEECDGGFLPVLHWQLSQAPYFIETLFMEGENLEDWIAQSKAQPAQSDVEWHARALAVVMNVAKVLACAHQNGIVHGDLSLKNILIQQANDGSEVAMLADFGSAELLPTARMQALEMSLPVTHSSGGHVSALLYAAPELLSGEKPSAASDVYALGVLLFQLLVRDRSRGLTPGWEAALADELLCTDIHAMCVADASKRISAQAVHEQLARLNQRHAEHATLQRLAQQNQQLARARRNRRRNFYVAAVFAVGSLVAGLGWWQAKQTSLKLAESLAHAEASEAKARSILQFMGQNVFIQASRSVGGDENIRLVDAMDRTVDDIFKSPKLSLEIKSDLLSEFAHTFVAIGDRERAVAITHRVESDVILSQNGFLMSELRFIYGLNLLSSGDLKSAYSVLEKTIEVQPWIAKDDNQSTIFLYLAQLEIYFGYLDQAEMHLTLVTPEVAATESAKSSFVSGKLKQEALLAAYQGKWAKADLLFKELASLEKSGSARSRKNGERGLAQLQSMQGNSKHALELQRAILSELEKNQEDYALTIPRLELARYLQQNQQFSEARTILQALMAQSGLAALNQYQLAEVLVGMAGAELGLGNVDSARAWLNKSLPQVTRIAPPDSRIASEIQTLSTKIQAAP